MLRPCNTCKASTRNRRQCSKCYNESVNAKRQQIACANCGELTSNAKYCKRSCAVARNNSLQPKRRRGVKPCKLCQEWKALGFSEYCDECRSGIHSTGETLRARARHENLVTAWLLGKESGTCARGEGARQFVRRYLCETYGERCADCGWNQVNQWTGRIPVQIEHDDGDRSNNSPSNVRLICGACHTLTPNYMARNSDANRAKRGLPPIAYSRTRKPTLRWRNSHEQPYEMINQLSLDFEQAPAA